VVTPSYNQAEFLEETLRSVLLQSYPALEYMVMDGGSQDGSQAIIERYAPWLAHWQSRPDGGQAAAVNEGLARARGAVFNFINSDDVLLPGTLAAVGASLAPGDAVGLAGAVIDRGPDGDRLFSPRDLSLRALLEHDHFHQPGIWLETAVLRDLGGYDATYTYCFDKALYLRLGARGADIALSDQPLAVFRVHPASKTSMDHARFRAETIRALRAVLPEAPAEDRLRIARRIEEFERAEARATLLAEAEALLAGETIAPGARRKVVELALRQPRAALDLRLLEALVFGTDRRQARRAARRRSEN
jgi:glycosyltransferase involved in cell wall biosynthesis